MEDLSVDIWNVIAVKIDTLNFLMGSHGDQDNHLSLLTGKRTVLLLSRCFMGLSQNDPSRIPKISQNISIVITVMTLKFWVTRMVYGYIDIVRN